MLWKEALEDICPSRRRLNCLGQYVAKSHRIQEWRWCALSNKLLRYHQGTEIMDTYISSTKRLNRYTKSLTSSRVVRGDICSVDKIQPGVFRVTSTAREMQDTSKPTTFVEVLQEWGCSWLWEHMTIKGGTEWIAHAITARSLVAVTDGSYTRQVYPHLCSAAFVLECSHGRGRLIGLFKEALKVANAYRGELLGLMAIHLILVSVNRVNKSLSGSTKVVSDCLGALQRVTYLPPYRIPSRCKHSDILKNILVNCRDLTFSLNYSHVKAHQDDKMPFDKLSRTSQLNCICNHLAKQRLSDGKPEPKGGGNFSRLSRLGFSWEEKNYRQKQGPASNSTLTVSLPRVYFIGRKYCQAKSSRK
jgi:hypothetical protein